MTWMVPLRSPRVTSHFNPRRRHPLSGVIRPHTGVDYGAPAGTRVRAARAGKVVRSGYDPPRSKGGTGAGNHLRIEHADGFTTRYYHLTERSVRVGDRVSAGDTIGTVGSTGDSTAPHLHFEIRRYGTPTDPVPILAASVVAEDDVSLTSSTTSSSSLSTSTQEITVSTEQLVRAILDADVWGRTLRERVVLAGNRATDARNYARAALEQAQTNAITLVTVGNRALRAQQNAARAVADVQALASILQLDPDALRTRSDQILREIPHNGAEDLPEENARIIPAPDETD